MSNAAGPVGSPSGRLGVVSPSTAAAFTVAGASAALLMVVRRTLPGWPRWLRSRAARMVLGVVALLALAVGANECAGKPVVFLRWSFLRFVFALNHMGATWQVGDGREKALADYVCAHARPGDVDDAIRVIDDFCYHKKYLINIGDEKGQLLDDAVAAARPQRLLEVGTYCGYSALRIARAMPADARLYSIEFNAANAHIAHRIWDHAGVGERIVVVVGTLGDDDKTIKALREEHRFSPGCLDFLFLDHEKSEYLPDLHRILQHRWLHPGSVVVADNVGYPGAPEYRNFMQQHEGRDWLTRTHRSHAEYQKLIPDTVLESTYLGQTTQPPHVD
ncbi:O-methyltransferase [Gordonia sp. NB41Y]|uniref:O-methyltransferase n=1 Tax=Gordonia sp. NB41Y TaxID=875808 RepID=UPI0026BFE52F|nr:O-methyltransferase [Gordonia sp. NB41Y]